MGNTMIPNESQQEEAGRLGAVPMWLWALISGLVLVAIAGGGLAGFEIGRRFEQGQNGDYTYQDTYWLLGAAVVDGEGGAVVFEDIAISGPAELAGILPGDRLTAIDGALVESAAAARRTIRAYGTGAYVTFSIERGERLEQIGMYLGYVYPIVEPPYPIDPPIIVTDLPVQPPDTQGDGRLGVYYRTLQRGDPFAVNNGALIITVWEGGAAQAAGLEPGDIITAVGGRTLSGSYTLADALGRYASSQFISLEVWDHRTGNIVTLTVRLGG